MATSFSDAVGIVTTDNHSMDMAARFLAALERRGFKNIPDFARQTGIPASSLYEIKRGTRPKDERMSDICQRLGVPEGLLAYGPDEAFVAALESHEPADPDPNHEGPSRQASETRSGELRSFPMDSAVMRDGRVVGPITYDAIKDPTGKGGMVLRLGHSRRGHKKEVETREVPAVGRDQSVVFVRERIEIRTGPEVDEVLKPGLALIVSPSATPEPGDLILVAKNIDWSVPVEGGSEDGLAGVTLMRYLEADLGGEKLLYGWPLDGVKAKRVQIDGPYSVVGVVVGRWSGREP